MIEYIIYVKYYVKYNNKICYNILLLYELFN